MTNEKCPECGGYEFYKKEVDATGGYGPNLLPGAGSALKSGKFEIRICGTCGYTKWFVPERFLKNIKEKGKFQKVV